MINKTNTTQKRNQTLLKTGRWTQLGAMEWLAVPGPLLTTVVLVLNDMSNIFFNLFYQTMIKFHKA